MMVWNILWLAAMAVAAMMAGFCMGRLSVRGEEDSGEEEQRRSKLRNGAYRAGVWEVETAGEGVVRAYGVDWKSAKKRNVAEGTLLGEKSEIRKSADITPEAVGNIWQSTSAVQESVGSIQQEQGADYDERDENNWTANVGYEEKKEELWASDIIYEREQDVTRIQSEPLEGSSAQRFQRRSRGSGTGEKWIVRATSAARAIVEESRRPPLQNYGQKVKQNQIDRTGRTFRGQRRSLGAIRLMHRGKDIQEAEGTSHSVGSPVSGYVVSWREGDHPMAVLQPMEDKLYAPAAGKITRLFPMGNEFLFVTEFGAELRIRAGDTDDDLLGRYFRPRVVQNEIVAKGKLLLEFDRQSLAAEGASTMVTLSVEHRAYGSNVRLVADEKIRIGEELLQIVERAESGNVRRE